MENIIGSRAVLYAEYCAEHRADVRAVHCAVVRADSVQNSVKPRRGDLFIAGEVPTLYVAPLERPVRLIYRSLQWSYMNRRFTVGYKEVAPLELKCRAEICADTRPVSCADEYAEPRAEGCAVLVQMLVQNLMQFVVQIFVQYDLQMLVQ